MAKKRAAAKSPSNGSSANLGFEAKLWLAADKLRNNMDAAEYNRNHVHNLPVVIPPNPIVAHFEQQVMPLMKQQAANADQSRALAAIRETLLPKLLSGEIRVAEAERLVEHAT